MRRVLAGVAIVSALLPVPATAAEPVVVIEGRGWGHGVGMAQDGALWMGRAGAATDKILTQFYPGTRMGKAGGNVRVPVLDAGAAPASAVLSFPGGGEIRDSPSGSQGAGFPVRIPPGGEARIVFEKGRYRVERPGAKLGRLVLAASRRQLPPLEPPAPPTTGPPPAPPEPPTPVEPPAPAGEPAPPETQPPAPATPVSARPLWAAPAGAGTISLPARQRRYRGIMEVTAGGGTLRVVNQLDVEQYLKGMGEVLDPSWPPASLRAQAVAARTYALRAMASSGEVCETQLCQVYLGAQAEYAAMNKAVEATAAQVLMFGRGLAAAVYSANGGGFSASQEEGFGVVGNDVSYLRPAPYTTKDPFPWSVTVAVREVRARLGYKGQLGDVRVTRAGPSGRALEVTLDGTSGPRTVTGIEFDALLGLRSTMFSLRMDQGEAPPLPPPDGAEMQVLPGQEAAAEATLDAAAPPAPTPGGASGAPRPPGRGGRLAASVVAGWSLLAVGATAAVSRAWWAPVSSRPSRRRRRHRPGTSPPACPR